MKKLLRLVIPCLLCTACELEMSDNGKLDGNWQLRQIDTLATSGTCDMSRSYIYWAVQNNLLQVRDIDDHDLKILFRFERQGNRLTLHSPHQVLTKDELAPLETNELLTPLGIMDTEDTFLIEKLGNSSLVLTNDLHRLHFRKY